MHKTAAAAAELMSLTLYRKMQKRVSAVLNNLSDDVEGLELMLLFNDEMNRVMEAYELILAGKSVLPKVEVGGERSGVLEDFSSQDTMFSAPSIAPVPVLEGPPRTGRARPEVGTAHSHSQLTSPPAQIRTGNLIDFDPFDPMYSQNDGSGEVCQSSSQSQLLSVASPTTQSPTLYSAPSTTIHPSSYISQPYSTAREQVPLSQQRSSPGGQGMMSQASAESDVDVEFDMLAERALHSK